jgi:ubiquinone/menaquinone biosynthesis C-methylase UbiE
MTEQWTGWTKRKAESFDRVAEAYDHYRPGYPEAAIDYIISTSQIPEGGKILEVGTGTGKATLPFARRGYLIHCVDQGKNLLEVARRNLAAYPSVTFENADFNTWEGPEAAFDLVISAQAWHWMDVSSSYKKAASVLKQEGAIALFWNKPTIPDKPVQHAVQEVYERVVPDLAREGPNYSEEEIAQLKSEIESSGYFHNLNIWRYPWSQRYSADEYLGLLGTFSDHVLLADETRQKLYAGIGEVIRGNGGFIDRPVITVVVIARKMDHNHRENQG